jgi:hypothetical protein
MYPDELPLYNVYLLQNVIYLLFLLPQKLHFSFGLYSLCFFFCLISFFVTTMIFYSNSGVLLLVFSWVISIEVYFAITFILKQIVHIIELTQYHYRHESFKSANESAMYRVCILIAH